MQIHPREIVILATDFTALMSWYRDALGFEAHKTFAEDFHYCNMETSTGIRIGIGSAEEMGVSSADHSNNTVILQIAVEDIKAFFKHIEQHGGRVTLGPVQDKKNGFWFGGIADPEGNPIWVVDLDCP